MAYDNAQFRADLASGEVCFPGGYTRRFIMSDGGILCFDCARKEKASILRSTHDGASDGWRVVACDVLWEGPAEYCAHCNRELATEYGDPNEGKDC